MLKKTFKGSDIAGVTSSRRRLFDGAIRRAASLHRPSQLRHPLKGSSLPSTPEPAVFTRAPGHGQEVTSSSAANMGSQPFNPVDDWGKYTDKFAEMKGTRVLDANPLVVQKLKDSGNLILEEVLNHSFPHCWRCHNPVIF